MDKTLSTKTEVNMGGINNSQIKALQDEIKKCETLITIGQDIYAKDKSMDNYRNIVYWYGEKDRLSKILQSDYDIEN